MKKTNIQWCHSTVNPVMGCDGCELWPGSSEIARAIELTLVDLNLAAEGCNQSLREVLGELQMSDIYRDRGRLALNVRDLLGLPDQTVEIMTNVIRRNSKCYAGLLGTMRSGHLGHAKAFDQPQQFPGRMAEAAAWPSPTGKEIQDKPWLSGMPRLIFISDMGDALSRNVPFEYLEREVIANVNSVEGNRHVWLWLSKRPSRMADFGSWLAAKGLRWPSNLVAMTTVTGTDTVDRVAALRKVPASCRALSLEPLFGSVNLTLDGVDWVIVGGGSDVLAEPFEIQWALDIRKNCQENQAAFFLKQLGRNPWFRGKRLNLTNSHGGEWAEWLPEWRTRQLPRGFTSLVMGDEFDSGNKPRHVRGKGSIQRQLVADLRESANHEAGHFIIASHFGLRPGALIIRAQELPTAEYKAFVGKTFFDRTTPFRKATIAWAGVLAEEILGNLDLGKPEDLMAAFDEITEAGGDQCSGSDRDGMKQCPPWRPFRTAADILFRKRDKLDAAAKHLERYWYVGDLNPSATEMRLWGGDPFTHKMGSCKKFG